VSNDELTRTREWIEVPASARDGRARRTKDRTEERKEKDRERVRTSSAIKQRGKMNRERRL